MSVLQTLSANFSVLSNRSFRIYLGGQTVSLIGTWLQMTALGWVVWELTGSTVDLGVVTMLNALPLLLLSPWAGAWADRFDRRKLIILTQVGLMASAFILAALVLTNSVHIWHIFAISLLSGVFAAIDLPAMQAFLGDLTGRDEVRRAINLQITVLQVSRILGPAVAGIVVGAVGAGVAFFLNGVSFLAVIYTLLIVRALQEQQRSSGGSALAGFRQAWQFVNSQPRIRDLVIFAMIVTFFGISIVMSLLPAVADELLSGGATTLGTLMSASGAGALVGVLVFAPLAQAQRRTGIALSLATGAAGVGFLILGLSRSLPLSMLGLFIGGLAVPTVITTAMGLVQFSAPLEMRARVMSLFNMVSFGLQPIAALWVGTLADWIGLRTAIELNAVAMIVGAGIMLARPALRGWVNLAGQPQPPVIIPAAVPLTGGD